MDAKMKANFINSVASGNQIPCPSCNAANDADAKFCAFCGAAITQPITQSAGQQAVEPVTPSSAAPFASISPEPVPTPVNLAINETAATAEVFTEREKTIEPVPTVPENRFAEGFPSWSIEPPQIMVRRKSAR